MDNVSGILNNREIAAGVWLLGLLIFSLRSKAVRQSLFGILRQIASPKLLIPQVLLAAYIGGCVYLLWRKNLWNVSLLRDTLYWFVTAGVLTVFKYVTAKKGKVPVKEMLIDNLKLVVVLEYLMNTYTFALWAEMVIFPILALVVMMNAYLEVKKEPQIVATFMTWVQAIFGSVLIAHALYSAALDYKNLGSFDTLRSFMLPILLSLAIIPAAYIMAVMAQYESLFIGFKLGKQKDRKFILHCKWRVIARCRLKTSNIAKLRPFDMMHLNNKKDVDEVLKRVEMSEEELAGDVTCACTIPVPTQMKDTLRQPDQTKSNKN
jgi:hypothetical protein